MSTLGRRFKSSAAAAAAVICFIGSAALITLTTTTAAEAAALVSNGCTASVQNPHYSSGAGGNIAKATWACSRVPTTINISYGVGGFWLWRCPNQPPKSESYLGQNCTIVGYTGQNVSVTKANTSYTRYAPPSGTPGARGAGWYMACTTWRSQGPGGTGSISTTFSNAVHLSS
jgi:hypothetical protein